MYAKLGAIIMRTHRNDQLIMGISNVPILSQKCDANCPIFLACSQLIFRVP